MRKRTLLEIESEKELIGEINQYRKNSKEIEKLEASIADITKQIKDKSKGENTRLKQIINYMQDFQMNKVKADKWVAELSEVLKYSSPQPSYKGLWEEALSKLNAQTVSVLKQMEHTQVAAKAKETEPKLTITENIFKQGLDKLKSLLLSFKSYDATVKSLPPIEKEKEPINEQFQRMQKLAGINENQEPNSSLKDKIKANFDKIVKLYNIDEQDLNWEELSEKLMKLLGISEKQADKFLEDMGEISEEAPEGKTKEWLNTYLEESPDELDESKKSDIPKGWDKEDPKTYSDEEEEVVNAYSAPMEGWDEENNDLILIVKEKDGTYKVNVTMAFGGDLEDEAKDKSFPDHEDAKKYAFEVMEKLKEDWKDEDTNENKTINENMNKNKYSLTRLIKESVEEKGTTKSDIPDEIGEFYIVIKPKSKESVIDDVLHKVTINSAFLEGDVEISKDEVLGIFKSKPKATKLAKSLLKEFDDQLEEVEGAMDEFRTHNKGLDEKRKVAKEKIMSIKNIGKEE